MSIKWLFGFLVLFTLTGCMSDDQSMEEAFDQSFIEHCTEKAGLHNKAVCVCALEGLKDRYTRLELMQLGTGLASDEKSKKYERDVIKVVQQCTKK